MLEYLRMFKKGKAYNATTPLVNTQEMLASKGVRPNGASPQVYFLKPRYNTELSTLESPTVHGKNEWYSPCLAACLWLDMPPHWKMRN